MVTHHADNPRQRPCKACREKDSPHANQRYFGERHSKSHAPRYLHQTINHGKRGIAGSVEHTPCHIDHPQEKVEKARDGQPLGTDCHHLRLCHKDAHNLFAKQLARNEHNDAKDHHTPKCRPVALLYPINLACTDILAGICGNRCPQ